MVNIFLAIVGFGNVGRSIVGILRDHWDRIEREYGVRFQITGVADSSGAVLSSGPLPPERLLEVKKTHGGVAHYPRYGVPGMTGLELVQRAKADILVEASLTNVVDGEPGLTHIKTALRRGVHVVTANKGPLVVAFAELRDLARARGLRLMYGPAAAAALPSIGMGTYDLAGSRVTRIEGVLNGTTNYILTQMRDRAIACQEALKEAQQRGMAETDPTMDLEGYDTASKLLIIANSVMGGALRLADVEREGITRVTVEEVRAAQGEGKAVKLMGTAWWEDARLRATVCPTCLDGQHALAAVDGSAQGIIFQTDLLGTLTVIGRNTCRTTTGASALRDLLNLVREARLV